VICAIIITLFNFSAHEALARESFRLSSWGKFVLGQRWGYVGLTGNIRIPAGGRPGSATRVDVQRSLGIAAAESSSVFMEGEILERHLIAFDYDMFRPTSVQRVQEKFRFHNKTYEKGAMVETKLDFNWLRAAYTGRALYRESFSLGPLIGVHHIRHGVTMNADTMEVGLISNTRRLDGTYPVLGAELMTRLSDKSNLRLEIEGVHMITRGFLAATRITGQWEVYPDVVMTGSTGGRVVHFIETNQKLNNEWFYGVFNISAGMGFTF
jgi:hypothetical protein